ncbi:MAG: hypothetical protein HC877_23730 [Thioploca sp.]|nr:hypothetical protein [Thioploca sp.]
MNTAVLTPKQWGLIFTLLSMDIIFPLYEAMGLEFKDKKNFLQQLRYLIIENRKVYETNPNAIPPLAEQVIKMLTTSFSQFQAKHFYHWATTVFTSVHIDQPQWSAWETLFHAWCYNATQQSKLKLSLEKREIIFSAYRKTVNIKDIERQVIQLKAQRLSDWDLEIYAIHQFNHDDELSDPFSSILYTIEINRFQLFLKAIFPQLHSSEKEILWERGQQLLVEREIWMPEPLKHLDHLLNLR